jgi:putative transposase
VVEGGQARLLTREAGLLYDLDMPRSARVAPGGMLFHVLNRGVGRMRLFSKEKDYEAFEALLEQTRESRPMRICAYCLMPNHWHMVLWPERDGDLAAFMQQLTTTHVRRWQLHRARVGYGHVYQSRYKSFPVEMDDYFYQLVRYVERNALRAGFVERAEVWQWSSLWRRFSGTPEQKQLLCDWPLTLPRNWRQFVNQSQSEAELDAIRRCVARGRPYGDEDWVRQTAAQLGLESTLRAPHRPRKVAADQ